MSLYNSSSDAFFLRRAPKPTKFGTGKNSDEAKTKSPWIPVFALYTCHLCCEEIRQKLNRLFLPYLHTVH